MDLREQILRHRKDSRVIGVGLALLLLVFSIVYYLLQRLQGQSEPVIANRLMLFVLWYVNVILILFVLFVLVRSVFRVLLDRRNRILGSRFQTKLVLAAIALSLIPVLLLFPFASRLLLNSFDRWFSLPVEKVVEEAKDVAEGLSHQIEETTLRDAHRALDELGEFDLADLEQLPALLGRMQELREELQLDYLAIYDGTEPIHGTADPQAGFSRDPRFRGLTSFLRKAMEEGEAIKLEDSLDIEGRLIMAACARERPVVPEDEAAEIPSGEAPEQSGDASAEVVEPAFTVLVAATVLPPDLADPSADLLRAHQQYLQLNTQKEDIRTSNILVLMMVTLLVILAFSLIGLRLTRRVMAPIQALAEGTRRISSGDLSHRVVVAVDDELGVLVDAFNRMTEELQRNKDLVESRNRELREANERVAAVLQNVAAGVLSIDPHGRIRMCNGAALTILHQRSDEVLGKTLSEAWPDPERGQLVDLLEGEHKLRRGVGHQVRLTVGSTWKTLEVKVTTLPDPGGRPAGRVVVLEDLTELIYAQKMAAWTEVARRIAHEIKNPLTPIKLTAERLLRKHRQNDPELGAKLEEGVEIIVREVASLKNLVDQFSRYARMPRPQPKDVDLRRFVSDTLQLYQDLKPGVEVRAEIDPGASVARFDPDQLRSVLINLLDNALEWTDPPGEVKVSTGQRNGTVLLHVADTGRGVPAEDISKLFQPYYSTKGRGTGLGLAIVQRIVADHHAQIRVGSNHPRGTVFTLEIPSQ